MSEVSDLIREGVAALKAGRRDEARELLVRATDLDQMNVSAWLWLSAAVDTVEEQRICLENVLTIDPHNERARKGLRLLGGQVEPLVQDVVPSGEPFAVTYSPSVAEVPESRGGRQPDVPPAEAYDYTLGEQADLPETAAGDVEDGPFTVWSTPSSQSEVRRSQIDPYALPQSSVFDVEVGESDETLAEEEPWDDDAYADTILDEGGASAMPSGQLQSAADTAVVDASHLIGYLHHLPPEIKPTHLPGKGPMYPPVLLAGLGLVGLGIIAALVVLVILLIG